MVNIQGAAISGVLLEESFKSGFQALKTGMNTPWGLLFVEKTLAD